MPEAVVQQRIVPGAPPPAPLSKTQKKKRKAKTAKSENDDAPTTPELTTNNAALTEKAPEPAEIQEGAVAPELIARTDSQGITIPEEDVLLKPSPIVDLVHKRLKATTKKIVSSDRILHYLIHMFNVDFKVTDNHLCRYGPRKVER